MNTIDTAPRFEVSNDCLCIVLTGDLDIATVSSVRKAIIEAATKNPRDAMVFDLRDLDFMDSAGLALLVFFYKSVMTKGCVRVLAARQSQPDRVLRIGRFDQILTVEN